ncbi:major facilitator superfamily transporter [Nitzschia inconspicua]|uniref:Major facilitator superfamily transporter n=1 Tax=Nitzschia inconspicua TaxID=303405 RepID=A0A9K3KSZ3_9STRA|nr:major facilitator superfamily transporter [Nitzschia inconspicua]
MTFVSTSTPKTINIDFAMELIGMGRFQYQILIAAGLCFMADAMEVLLLSFLSPILQQEWTLSGRQMNTIISVVFAGALCGTLILSPLGDVVGRKPVFRVTAAMIALFGLATALCQTYPQLLLMRFLVGFGVGGLTVPFDTLSEFLPLQARGSNLLYIEFFWTLGTLSVPLMAYLSLQQRGDWQLFVVLCSIPCIVSTISGVLLVPESPRWLLEQGRHEEALLIMRQAAECNGHNADVLFPEGTVLIDPLHHHVQQQQQQQHHHHDDEADLQQHVPNCSKSSFQSFLSSCCDWSNVRRLFSPTWRRTTLLLWGCWLGFGFLYYGVIIAVSLVFSGNDNIAEDGNDNDELSFDYLAISISASAEVFGLLAVLYTIDRYGRIMSQAVAYYVGGVAGLALGILAYMNGPRWSLIVFAFMARMAMMAASCTTWVSTTEILSTDIRTTGHGAANAMARIGGFLCPYFITQGNSLAMIGVLVMIVAVLTAECSRRLPETAGKAMGALGCSDHDDYEDGTSSLAGGVSDDSDGNIHGARIESSTKPLMNYENLEQTSSISTKDTGEDENCKAYDDPHYEPTTSYQKIL